jgi:hypothetical protein
MIFAGHNPEEMCELMCGEPQRESEEDDGNQSNEAD